MHRHRRIVAIVRLTIIYDVNAYLLAYVYLYIAMPTIAGITFTNVIAYMRADVTIQSYAYDALLTPCGVPHTPLPTCRLPGVCALCVHTVRAEQCGCVLGTPWTGGWDRTSPQPNYS